MKKDQIYKIASIISEDPDILNEEDESDIISLTYTNIFDETKKVTIRQAWEAYNPQAGFFFVEWAAESPTTGHRSGILTKEGLDPDSLIRMQAIAQSYTDYRAHRRRAAKEAQEKYRYLSKADIWDYMWATYGRCCPNWYKDTHDQECLRERFVGNRRYAQRSRADRRPGRIDAPLEQTAEQLEQTPEQPKELRRMYHTDYGTLRVRPTNFMPGKETWVVSFPGEDEKEMDYDEIVDYLSDAGVQL